MNAGAVMVKLREQALIGSLVERLDVFTPPKDWMRGAPCIDKPDAMFFPDGRGVSQLARQGEAICQSCPKRMVCVIDALQNEQHQGRNDIAGRRWLSAGRRAQILKSLQEGPEADSNDDLDLMLALCERINSNLTTQGATQP